MSAIKKLAGQTMWYGVSSIAARFINYLLTPLITYAIVVTPADFGKVAIIYAAIPLFNIIFTYGFETTYFRFSAKQEHKSTIYNTSFLSLLFSTLLFTPVLWLFKNQFANFVGLPDFVEIIQFSILIIAFDALSTIPFAKLRQEGRPIKFAFVKVAGILINIFFTWFFIMFCPNHADNSNSSLAWLTKFYNPNLNPIYYIILANLLQSVFTLLLLYKEILQVRFKFDAKLWKKMIVYAMPLIIVGFGGMINETFDRVMLRMWLPGADSFVDKQVGIYNACYKLSIIITIFIQAFRMGAEPFFFNQEGQKDDRKTYARVMKFFVLVICLMFLVVVLFLPIWKYFIGPRYWEGLTIVPILLFANMFLGIYYNLSIWYKLSDRTLSGAYITLIGVVITAVINYLFIPKYGYLASAWATFACYGSMMVICFLWGKKVYPIPYAWKKLSGYLAVAAALYFLHRIINYYMPIPHMYYITSVIFVFVFIALISKTEKEELIKLPVIGKYFK